MPDNEANFDLYIYDLLKNAGINAEAQGSAIADIKEALKTASKRQTGKSGAPEFIAVVQGFVIVIEDKASRDKLCLYEDDNYNKNKISLSINATENYAVNGALWYAEKILENTGYKKIFAFGCAGDRKHHVLKPVFVDDKGIYKELDEVETFENFNNNNIEKYYRRVVLGETPPEELTLEEILRKARTLHEHLRNYGALGDAEKPLVVSAILLALREKEHGFSLDQLNGDTVKTDGEKLYEHVESNLKRVKVAPPTKLKTLLNQFTLIKDRPKLNEPDENLNNLDDKDDKSGENNKKIVKTPLKFFAEYIDKNIFNAVVSNNSPEDYLGRFYGEFMSYSGGDGQSLGVVLTPRHITELFCDLVDLKPEDVIFDPCCGTGGFLVAGMYRMLDAARDDAERSRIKSERIHGIELREDMFSIATTNMILRGDGQSNLVCADFLKQSADDIKSNKKVTVGFMNPPYSQSKNDKTANLSELNFIAHLLDCIADGGRAAVIVPLSAMIGKTKNDKFIKSEILKKHTLEGVITLNKKTFHGIGVNPCIAIFTAGRPHDLKKLVKFINFEDDGFVEKKNIGLVETERAKDRKEYLLDCWRGHFKTVSSKFMVETAIKSDDEWLHSFYYYNDEIPTEQDFMNSIADYLTFEFNMIAHGRGYLFGVNDDGDDDKNKKKDDLDESGKNWGEFEVGELFNINIGKAIDGNKIDKGSGRYAYITRKENNNGLDGFIEYEDKSYRNEKYPAITIGNETAEPYVQVYPFYTGTKVNILSPKIPLSKYKLLFIVDSLRMHKTKYSYSFTINSTRLKKQKILLPVDADNQPDWAYMEQYVKEREQKLLENYMTYIKKVIEDVTGGGDIESLSDKKWGEFMIEEVAEINSGHDIDDDERINGNIPYISSSSVNNGICYFINNVNETLEAECISVNRTGSVGYAFYHPYPALYSNNCRKLRPHFQNKYIVIFLATQITAQRNKYSYGYIMGTARLKKQKLLLPVDTANKPDWNYMERYVKDKMSFILKRYIRKYII